MHQTPTWHSLSFSRPVPFRLAHVQPYCTVSNQMDTGDITTLANPDVVAQIRELVQGRNVGPLKEGPEDIKRFGDER